MPQDPYAVVSETKADPYAVVGEKSAEDARKENFSAGLIPSGAQILPPLSLLDKAKIKAKQLLLEAPPAIGATVGAILGAGGGPAGSVAGATIGGAGGKALSNIAASSTPSMQEFATNIGIPPPPTSMEAARQIGTEGVMQGAIEAGSAGLARVAKAAAPALRTSAESSMRKVLAPTTIENKAIADKVVPQMVDRGVMAATRKGLEEKSATRLASAGKAIDAVVDALPPDLPVSAQGEQKLFQSLKDYRDQFVVDGVPVNKDAVKAIDGIAHTINDVGANNLSVQSLRQVRQILDKAVSNSSGFLKGTKAGTRIDAQREAANSIRSVLADEVPDLAKVNAEFSFWKGVNTVISKTNENAALSKPSLSQVALNAAATTGGYAAGGFKGAAIAVPTMAALQTLVTSSAWRTVSSASKAQLATALAKNDTKTAFAIMGRMAHAIGNTPSPSETPAGQVTVPPPPPSN